MSATTFAERYRSLTERLSRERERPIVDWQLFHLPGDSPPWTNTDLTFAPGDEVTWPASGRVVASERLGSGVGLAAKANSRVSRSFRPPVEWEGVGIDSLRAGESVTGPEFGST